MTRAILSLIDRAYRLDVDDQHWLQTIAEQAAAMVPSSDGAMAYEFDASEPEAGVRIPRYAAFSVPGSFVPSTLRLNSGTTADDAARFYHRGVICGTVSEVLRRSGLADLQPGEAVALRVIEGSRGRMALQVAAWERALQGSARQGGGQG